MTALSKVARRKACIELKQSLCGKRLSTSLAMVSQRTTLFLTLSSLISVLGFKLTIKTSGFLLSWTTSPRSVKKQQLTLPALLDIK